MPRDESEIDKETFDRVLAEELGKGTSQRVAEGRARSAAIKAFRAARGEPGPKPPKAPAAGAAAAGGNGAGGNGAGTAAPVPVGVGAAAASGTATGPAPTLLAPGPTGRVPAPKQGQADKHRLLALVA